MKDTGPVTHFVSMTSSAPNLADAFLCLRRICRHKKSWNPLCYHREICKSKISTRNLCDNLRWDVRKGGGGNDGTEHPSCGEMTARVAVLSESLGNVLPPAQRNEI